MLFYLLSFLLFFFFFFSAEEDRINSYNRSVEARSEGALILNHVVEIVLYFEKAKYSCFSKLSFETHENNDLLRFKQPTKSTLISQAWLRRKLLKKRKRIAFWRRSSRKQRERDVRWDLIVYIVILFGCVVFVCDYS